MPTALKNDKIKILDIGVGIYVLAAFVFFIITSKEDKRKCLSSFDMVKK